MKSRVLLGSLVIFFSVMLSSCEEPASFCSPSVNISECESCCINDGQQLDIYDPVSGDCFCR